MWCAVSPDGEVFDVFVQARIDGKAAKRFFRRALKRHENKSRKLATDKPKSYGVALRESIPEAIHDASRCANNRTGFFIPDLSAGTRNAPFQIAPPSATIFRCACGYVQSFQARSAPECRAPLSRISSACLSVLGKRGSRIRYWGGCNPLVAES